MHLRLKANVLAFKDKHKGVFQHERTHKKTAIFTRKTAVLQTLYQILIMLLLLHLLVSASCVP